MSTQWWPWAGKRRWGRKRRCRPWTLVRVSGPSMVPALRDGDVVVAISVAAVGLWVRGVRPGDVVLARYRSMPDRLVVKRAVRRAENGWWLSSDNPFAGGSSAVHGIADVTGRVVLRWSGRILTRVPAGPSSG